MNFFAGILQCSRQRQYSPLLLILWLFCFFAPCQPAWQRSFRQLFSNILSIICICKFLLVWPLQSWRIFFHLLSEFMTWRVSWYIVNSSAYYSWVRAGPQELLGSVFQAMDQQCNGLNIRTAARWDQMPVELATPPLYHPVTFLLPVQCNLTW